MNNDFITEIVSKYRKTIIRVALGYVKNIHDAEDIAQNVFLKFFDKYVCLDNEESQKAWLIRVTINESKNLLKSAWFRKRNDLDESLIAPQEEDLGIYEYVKRLKPKYRTVIYLYYYENYSANEVAQILKMPPATVATHLRRAREQLKDIITKEDSYYGKQVHSNV
jgi:RNA polymerase sigma-70 factor (ECF subfamily)